MDTTAQVRRSGDWWAIEVPEVPGLFTQVRRLDQVADTVRDAGTDLGVTINDVDINVLDVPTDAVTVVRTHLEELDRLQRTVAQESREVAARLRDKGLSVRDTGYLMGVSAQRVSQLTGTPSTTTRKVRVTTPRTTRNTPVAVRTTTTTRTGKASSKRV